MLLCRRCDGFFGCSGEAPAGEDAGRRGGFVKERERRGGLRADGRGGRDREGREGADQLGRGGGQVVLRPRGPLI